MEQVQGMRRGRASWWLERGIAVQNVGAQGVLLLQPVCGTLDESLGLVATSF